MTRRVPLLEVRHLVALAAALAIPCLLLGPTHAATAPITAGTLLINQTNHGYPNASDIRGQQVLMLLRHFDPNAEIVSDSDYRRGMASSFDRLLVLGNDAVTPVADAVQTDVLNRPDATMWVGYGLGDVTADPDKDFGFAPVFVESGVEQVDIEYRGDRYPTELEERHHVRIASPDVAVYASVVGSGDPIPLAVRHHNLWFFGGLPSLDSIYPDPSTDTATLIFADWLNDFFGVDEHQPAQALIRLEDVSVHIPPQNVIDAVDALSSRGIPFVVGVIPAQQTDDGLVESLADHPDFVQALRYAQDHGGTIALHGYHHTFGQGEDFEFWDPARNAPPLAETWDAYALKVEDGIRELQSHGLEPRLWETPHYAASPLGYRVFAAYFSHAIENRDPVTWLPYVAGPDPGGQILIPENLGYINEAEGLSVDDQLARAKLLRIVRDAYAVGFYHPASIPVSDLERLVDGLRDLGYEFGDVRTLNLVVRSHSARTLVEQVTAAVRIEPGVVLLELQRTVGRIASWTASLATSWVMPFAFIGVFLWRLRAQWRSTEMSHTSRVEAHATKRRTALLRSATVLAAVVASLAVIRLAALSPDPPRYLPLLRAVPLQPKQALPVPIDGWELSTYYTAVEEFYAGAPVQLRGCPTIDCANGDTILGRFPTDFLEAVKAEGSGRLASPSRGKTHINWSIDVGYWLDSAPRDAQGSVLEPFVSAAADPEISYVSTIAIKGCGTDILSGRGLPQADCKAFQEAHWIVRDRFTVGQVGKHLDLYVGEQNRPDFLDRSPVAIHTTGAAITLARYSTNLWAS